MVKSFKLLSYTILLIYSIIVIFPLTIVVTGSFRTPQDLYNNPFGIPKTFTISNFVDAFTKGHMQTYVSNSVIIAVVSLGLIIIISTLAAYSLSRSRFKFSKIGTLYFMLGLAIPVQIIMVPSYLIISRLKLTNNLLSLIIVDTTYALPFAIFLLIHFFKTIPVSLEEAAIIDGCNHFKYYSKIILPLSKPSLATIVLLNLISIWNDFYNPLIYIRDEDKKPLAMAILAFRNLYTVNYSLVFASVVLMSIPLIIIFMIGLKSFTEGLMAGAVKG